MSLQGQGFKWTILQSFCGYLSGDGSSTATVYGWKVSMLSKAEVAEEGAVCWASWPLSSHTQHMGALQEGKKWPPGAGLDASFLSQDNNGVLDDIQLMGQARQNSITPTT